MRPSNTLGALALAFASALAPTAASATEILVPAYFYPSFDPMQSYWDELTAAAASGARVTAIMNPDNGPGSGPNGDYTAAINAFRAAGGRVLGYVYTCYGRNLCVDGLPSTRSVGDVLTDVERYATWYAVDGIFLDEMSNRESELGFYGEVASALRSAHAGWQIVGNPGNGVPEAYLAVADTLVTYEGDGSYANAGVQPWMQQADPARQAHLIYNVSDEAGMHAALQQALARRAGYVYITDDRYTPGNPAEPNPWNQLASYWVAQTQAVSAVPEPPVWALLLVGVGVAIFRARGVPRVAVT
jgi:hypothetical protein